MSAHLLASRLMETVDSQRKFESARCSGKRVFSDGCASVMGPFPPQSVQIYFFTLPPLFVKEQHVSDCKSVMLSQFSAMSAMAMTASVAAAGMGFSAVFMIMVFTMHIGIKSKIAGKERIKQRP